MSRRSETRGAPDRMRRGAPHAREDATHAHDSHFQLQGRRRQDDDRREPGGDLRRPGPSDPARRPRPAGVGDRLLRAIRRSRVHRAQLHIASLRERPRREGDPRNQDSEPEHGAVAHRPYRPERADASGAAAQIRARRRFGRLRHSDRRLLARHEAPCLQCVPRRNGRRTGDRAREARRVGDARDRAHGERHASHRRRPAHADAPLQDSEDLRSRPRDAQRGNGRGGSRPLLPERPTPNRDPLFLEGDGGQLAMAAGRGVRPEEPRGKGLCRARRGGLR